MANNQLVKWFIGLSSVALFTGFIGLSGQYDQENQASANDKSNNDDTKVNQQDSIKQQWQSADPSISNNADKQNANPSVSNDQDRQNANPSITSNEESNQNSFQESEPSMTNDQPFDSGNSRGMTSNNTRHGRMRSHAS